MDDELMDTLLKRAKGYTYDEVQEEFAMRDDGEMALVKRKIAKKYCPPDSNALRAYIELTSNKSLSEYSDEELLRERDRIVKEYLKGEKEAEAKEDKRKSHTAHQKNSDNEQDE